MKTLPTIIVLILASNVALDSLFGRLAFQPNEFETLKKIAVATKYKDPKLSKKFLDSAYKYSPNDFETYHLRCIEGVWNRKLDTAIYFGNLAIREKSEAKDRRVALMNLASAYLQNEQYDEARDILAMSDTLTIEASNLMGNIYSCKERYDSARYFYYKVAQKSYDINNKNYLAFAYANIANTYIPDGDTISAMGMLMVSLRYSKTHEATVLSQMGMLTSDTSYLHQSLRLNPSPYDRVDSYKGLYGITRENRWLDSAWLYADAQSMIYVRMDSAEKAGDFKLALYLHRQIEKKPQPNIYINTMPKDDSTDYTMYIYFIIFNFAIWIFIKNKKYLPL